jgi:maltose/moltooligosaccharide transporter
VLFLAVLWTVLTTREYSPEQLEAFSRYESAQSEGLEEAPVIGRTDAQYRSAGIKWLAAGVVAILAIRFFNCDFQLYILAVGAGVFGVLQLLASTLLRQGRTENGFYEVTHDLFHMPTTMKQLAVVQFFSWFALFTMWIYSTAAVTDYHYGTQDTTSSLYNQGADWVGVLFASYNAFAALAAFAIPLMARWTSRKTSHIINLCLGGIGLMSFVVVKDPAWLLLSMVGVGIAWASILSMPYAILSCSLPAHKMGVYMGIFNFFIVIPQILAATVLGLLVRVLFTGNTIYALVFAGICMLLAAAATLLVNDEGAEA